jgi:hypothetical protein
MGHVGTTSDSQIIQSLISVFPTGGSDYTGNYSEPTYFNGAVYYAPVDGSLMAFSLTNGRLSTQPTSESSEVYNGSTSTVFTHGGETAISANGNSNGILWALQSNGISTRARCTPTTRRTSPRSTGTAISRARATSWIRG